MVMENGFHDKDDDDDMNVKKKEEIIMKIRLFRIAKEK